MKIAITGSTGFLGRELVAQLVEAGHDLKCWTRPNSDRTSLERFSSQIEWVSGELADGHPEALIGDCEAIVHAGLARAGRSFQASPLDLVEYARVNVLGTLELMQAAVANHLSRFVFVSTCAVHDRILDDRPLDESHPLWPATHYGAYKAAIEKFVHSYGLGQAFPSCALRPTGIYGVDRPVEHTKWYSLIDAVASGRDVDVSQGGKEVHVADVASAIQLLLDAPPETIRGEAFSCFDCYISEYDVAHLTQQMTGSHSRINGVPKTPKHQIDTTKIRRLGMTFGGQMRLKSTIEQILELRNHSTRG